MSNDASVNPLDLTIEIRFVPSESGSVSDRSFDPNDLSPESDWRRRVELLENRIDSEIRELDMDEFPPLAPEGEGGAAEQVAAPPPPPEEGQQVPRAEDAPAEQPPDRPANEPVEQQQQHAAPPPPPPALMGGGPPQQGGLFEDQMSNVSAPGHLEYGLAPAGGGSIPPPPVYGNQVRGSNLFSRGHDPSTGGSYFGGGSHASRAAHYRAPQDPSSIGWSAASSSQYGQPHASASTHAWGNLHPSTASHASTLGSSIPPVTSIHVQPGMGGMGPGGAARPPPGGGGHHAPPVPQPQGLGGVGFAPQAGVPLGLGGMAPPSYSGTGMPQQQPFVQQQSYHQQAQYPAGLGGQSNSMLFTATADVPITTIAMQYGVVVPKTRRMEGTEEGRKIQQDATRSIENKLGVPRQFVRNADGEADEGNETKDRYLQDMFASSLVKVEELNKRLVEYDMKRIFFISALMAGVTLTAVTDISKIWVDGTEVDLMLYWDRITFEQVCYWQLACNLRVPLSSHDRTSMTWALQLIQNSCTSDLKARVAMTYDSLNEGYKGAVTYMWCVLDFLFAMSEDQVQSLKNYFKVFAQGGLKKVKGENVPTVSIPLYAAARRLESIGHLENIQIKFVLEGLSKCSIPKFAKVFDAMLTDYSAHSILPNGGHRCWGHAGPWQEFDYILRLALTHHGNLTTDPKNWNLARKGLHSAATKPDIKCWNCGDPTHNLGQCPKKKDKKRIDQNRKEFYEKRKQNQPQGGGPGRGGAGRGGGGGRGGGREPSNDGNYQRGKWAPPGGNADVLWHEAKPHHYCATCRKSKLGINGSGWNRTHDTKWHQQAQEPGFSVLGTLAQLDPTNKLVLAVRANQPPIPSGAGSVTDTSASTMTGNTLNTQPPSIGALRSHQHGVDMFRRYLNLAPSQEARDFVERMREGFGLNE